MSDRQTVWIDLQRCTGCATCVGVCPVGAVAMVQDKAHIDQDTCTGCGACVDACPEGAIEYVVEGEIVRVEGQPLPVERRPAPVAEVAGAAAVATATALARKATTALVQAAGRWLTDRSAVEQRPAEPKAQTGAEATDEADRGSGARGGHRARRRRRGR